MCLLDRIICSNTAFCLASPFPPHTQTNKRTCFYPTVPPAHILWSVSRACCVTTRSRTCSSTSVRSPARWTRSRCGSGSSAVCTPSSSSLSRPSPRTSSTTWSRRRASTLIPSTMCAKTSIRYNNSQKCFTVGVFYRRKYSVCRFRASTLTPSTMCARTSIRYDIGHTHPTVGVFYRRIFTFTYYFLKEIMIVSLYNLLKYVAQDTRMLISQCNELACSLLQSGAQGRQ